MKKVGLICIAVVMALGSIGVSYAKWSTNLYMNGSMVTAPTSTTVTLSATQDSYIDSGATNSNFGNSVNLLEGKWGGTDRKALIKFNFSSIPNGATIDSAILWLYANAVNQTDTVNIYRLRRSWVEGNGTSGSGVTWSTTDGSTAWGTYGAASTSTDFFLPSAFARYINAIGSYSWTITSEVQAFVSNTATNNGWIFYGTLGSANRVTFNSREAGSNTPYLIVIYH